MVHAPDRRRRRDARGNSARLPGLARLHPDARAGGGTVLLAREGRHACAGGPVGLYCPTFFLLAKLCWGLTRLQTRRVKPSSWVCQSDAALAKFRTSIEQAPAQHV